MKATKNHDHFHSEAKEKTDVKSLLVNKNYFTLEHFCIKNINKPAPLLHFLLILLKTLTREDCCLAIFPHKLRIQVSQDHMWIEQV